MAAHDKHGILRSALGAIEAIFACVDSYLGLDPWIDAMEPYVEDAAVWDSDADRTRAWYVFLQAALTRRPTHRLIPSGVAWLRERLRSGHATAAETLSAGGVLMFYACLAAEDEVAFEVMALTKGHLDREDAPPLPRWTLLYWEGLYHLWKLQYVDAVRCWEYCSRIGAQCGLGLLDFLVHGNLVMVDLAEDRLDQAEVRLRALDEAGVRGHRIAYGLFWMGQTFLRLYRGRSDLPEALAAMVQSSRAAGLFIMEMLCLTDAAAVHLLRGDDVAAASLLDDAESRLKGSVVRQCDGQVMALRAGILYRRGEIEAAHRQFGLALQEVARGGTCGCMLWVRAGLSALLAEAVRYGQHAATVRELVRRFEIPAPARAGAEWPWPVRIRALGPLSVEIADSPVGYGRKAQQKVLELLKLLIAEGAREVDGGAIADSLWPDVDGDAAQSNLRGTVKRLREYLGHAEAVRLFDGKLSLNERICWLDVWAFRDWCGSLLTDGSEAEQRASEALSALYRGPLLQGEQGSWLLTARRRERERFGRVLERLSTRDEGAASRLRDHALIVDPEAATT